MWEKPGRGGHPSGVFLLINGCNHGCESWWDAQPACPHCLGDSSLLRHQPQSLRTLPLFTSFLVKHGGCLGVCYPQCNITRVHEWAHPFHTGDQLCIYPAQLAITCAHPLPRYAFRASGGETHPRGGPAPQLCGHGIERCAAGRHFEVSSSPASSHTYLSAYTHPLALSDLPHLHKLPHC